jgi:uncharacterized membrane protein
MPAPILYCGDTELSGAAAYLAGLITHAGWSFDYVPSHQPLTSDMITADRRLIILSDYPAALARACQSQIVERVARGMGLLMIGGWESFHGLGGDWDGTPISRLLGVTTRSVDDRCNSFTPALLAPTTTGESHPILAGLPWREHPPFLGGWNLVDPGPGETLLEIHQFQRCRVATDGSLLAAPAGVTPGLVVHRHGDGRTAAFLSDVAPHWVGGFVDWGDHRVTAQAPGAPTIEVGGWYATFWRQLLAWTGRLDAA